MHHQSLAVRKRCRLFVRRLLAAARIIAALAFCATQANAAELLVTNEAFPAKAQNKQLHAAIAAHKGHPVLINFWATWCEPCREEMPALQRLAKRWQARGLTVITVAVADNPRQVSDTLEKLNVQLPVIHDPEQQIIQRWGVSFLPTTLILDARQRIRLRGQGAIDWDAAAIDRQLQPLFK